MLQQRGIEYDTFADWLKLDEIEQQRGAAVGRPRIKFTTVASMLEALREVRGNAADPIPKKKSQIVL
ncbi:MAG: hypothetical protein U0703_02105 [Anaerolineae bacterium]